MIIGFPLLLAPVTASNVDPAAPYCWSENAGWIKWRHHAPSPGDGVCVFATHLSGFAWAENLGWIHLGNGAGPYANNPASAATFGVNVDSLSGELYGKAWGENIGWINFDTRTALGSFGDQARLDVCENRFRGFAWAENIGWINLDDVSKFVALGPDCTPGDLACDEVIAVIDVEAFLSLMDGPDSTVNCGAFDADADADIDLSDFADLQIHFTGEP